MNLFLSDGLAGRFLRFCLVGGISTLSFAALTWLAVEALQLEPEVATVACYLVLVPWNFLAHRNFTFVSSGKISSEGLRFLLLHSLNLGLSSAGMAVAVRLLHIDYRWGIAFSAVAVPVIVFVVMNYWVFRSHGARSQH